MGCGQWGSNTAPQQGNTFRSSRDPLDEIHDHYLVSHLADFSPGATTPPSAGDQRVPSSHFPAFLPHIPVSYDAIYMPSVPIVEEPQVSTAVSPTFQDNFTSRSSAVDHLGRAHSDQEAFPILCFGHGRHCYSRAPVRQRPYVGGLQCSPDFVSLVCF